jgi:anti-sigma B factor antagonist
MEIKNRTYDHAFIIDVKGEVDMYSSPQLRKQILKTLRKKPPMLVVNLSRVTYMDSSGIATLVEGLQLSNGYGGKLRLAGLEAAVREVFRFARLETIFDIYENEEQALMAG